LVRGLGTAESKAVNDLSAKINLTANEAMFPCRIDGEAVGQEVDAAGVIGAADEDDLAVSVFLEANGRPREARGSGLLPLLGFEVVCGDEAVRTVAQLSGIGVVEAFPHFGLPEVVERFNLVLDTMFAGRGEDRRDSQGETKERNRTEPIRMVVRAVKTEVVVELSVSGQAVCAPVSEQRDLSEIRGDGGGEKAAAQPAVQGDRIEDLDLADILDDEPLDDIEGVQFNLAVGDCGKVPTRRRWSAADPTGNADQAVALEYIGNAGAAWQRLAGPGLRPQGTEDGEGPKFPQGVPMAESMPQGEDPVNKLAGERRWAATRAARLVPEGHAMQALAPSVANPGLDVRESEPELAGDLAQGHPAPSQADQFASMLWREFFMLATLVAARIDVSSVPAPLRSASTTLTSMRETPEAIKVPK
jgi:hypothetical protein